MKEYKYRQYKFNIPLQDDYADLIRILDTYPTHTRNRIIIETLHDGLVCNGEAVRKQSGTAEDYNMSTTGKSPDMSGMEEQQNNNVKIMEMLETLTEKIRKLENRENIRGEESRKDIADKKMTEAKTDMPHKQKKTSDSEPADKENEITPEVSTEVLDFLNALGNS